MDADGNLPEEFDADAYYKGYAEEAKKQEEEEKEFRKDTSKKEETKKDVSEKIAGTPEGKKVSEK